MVLLLVGFVCIIAAALCPFCGPAGEGGDGGAGGECVCTHTHAQQSLSVCIIRFLKHMEWDLSLENCNLSLEFVKASTHEKSVSMLSLVTVIVFVIWGQKKFKSWDIVVVCLCIYLPLLFELFQAAVPVQRSPLFHSLWKAAQARWLIRMYLMKRLRE